MKASKVVKVKTKKVKVSSVDDWMKFIELLGIDIDAGTIGRPDAEARARAQSSGSCEAACSDHGGVDLCGEHVALCHDGSAFIIRT